MAVCGRCLICGYKFDGRLDDGTEPDAAIRWECKTCPSGWGSAKGCVYEPTTDKRNWADRACAKCKLPPTDHEPHEHAICQKCHEHLVDNKAITVAAEALLALVRERALPAVDTDPLVQALRQKVVSTYYDHHGDWPEDEYVDDMMKQLKDVL